MRRIVISDDAGNEVALIKDLEFEIMPEFVGETVMMASGRTVRDHVGIKNTLKIPTGWLSPEDLGRLCRMIGAGQVLWISYPDVDGDHTDEFWVNPPRRKSFSYDKDGVKQWYGVELTASQYGVSTISTPAPGGSTLSADIVDGAFVITGNASGAVSDGAFVIGQGGGNA